jgi:hypothetical protein
MIFIAGFFMPAISNRSGDYRKTLAIINYGTPNKFPEKLKLSLRKMECKIHFAEKCFSTVSGGI